MALTPLEIQKRLQQGQLIRMLDEGFVNGQFLRVQCNRDPWNPYYLVHLINEYLAEIEAIILQLRSLMDLPYADFYFLVSQSRYIAWRSASIGAEHVRAACSDLFQACEEKNKQKFCEGLELVYNDFKSTRIKLRDFAEMEHSIVTMGGF